MLFCTDLKGFVTPAMLGTVSAPIPDFPSELGLASLDFFLSFLKEKGVLFVFLLQQQEFSKGTVTASPNLPFLKGALRSGEVFSCLVLNFGTRLGQSEDGAWGHHPQLCAGTPEQRWDPSWGLPLPHPAVGNCPAVIVTAERQQKKEGLTLGWSWDL